MRTKRHSLCSGTAHDSTRHCIAHAALTPLKHTQACARVIDKGDALGVAARVVDGKRVARAEAWVGVVACHARQANLQSQRSADIGRAAISGALWGWRACLMMP